VRPALRVMLVSLSCLGVLVSPACAATFTVEQSMSSLVVQIFREGAAAKLGHDHVIHATSFSGRVTYDPTAPAASSITVQVHTATLKVDDPATRQKFHLPGGPTAIDVTAIEKNMKAESQLHVAKFPMITFVSTTITAETEDRYLVTGQLTIRGVTNAVRFPAHVAMEGHAFRGTATITFTQSAFGYTPYSVLLGAIKNRDAVLLHIDLVAVPE